MTELGLQIYSHAFLVTSYDGIEVIFVFEGLLFAMAIFAMTVGLISIILFCILKLISPKEKQKYYVLLPLRENGDPSAVISAALEKRNLLGETAYCEIVAVDCDLSKETRCFLNNLYGKNQMFSISDPSEVLTRLPF